MVACTALLSLALAAWLVLLIGRGGFWRAREVLPSGAASARVTCVIPARDEAETIGAVVSSHLAAPDGPALLVLADDGSTDGTAQAASAAVSGDDRLAIVPVPTKPREWSGKLWALRAGIAFAEEAAPETEYLLLTDADIEPAPDLVPRLVAAARRGERDMVSVMARLDDRGWGALLVPAFVFFFAKLYPFASTADPHSPVAGAAGGVVLVRREALARTGGIGAIRGALIDDCALAAAVKRSGGRIALYHAGPTPAARSLRDNRAYGSIRDMVARTAFTQLGHSYAAVAGTALGMALLYLAGPLAVLSWPVHGSPILGTTGLAVWTLMSVAYVPTLRLYGRPASWAPGLPLAAALYTWFTMVSAWRHARGRGGQWKGRTYASADSAA